MSAELLTSLLLSAFAELRWSADKIYLCLDRLVELLGEDMPPEAKRRVSRLLNEFDRFFARLDGYATHSEMDFPADPVAPPLAGSAPDSTSSS